MENKVPWKQALCYTIERALITYDWLKEEQKEYVSNISKGVSGAELAARVRILCDVFSVYLTTLVDGGKNRTFSLKQNFPAIFTKVKNLEIVKKCKDNRHHRSAHESDTYGHFVSSEDILNSDIRNILEDIRARIIIDEC